MRRYIDEFSVTGLTSNPTIFDQAIESTAAYDGSIRDKANAGQSGEELFVELALEDLRRAADLFRPTFDATEEFARVAKAQTPGFAVEVSLPRTTLRSEKDKLSFTVQAQRDGFLYVFNRGSDGSLLQLYPNDLTPSPKAREIASNGRGKTGPCNAIPDKWKSMHRLVNEAKRTCCKLSSRASTCPSRAS